MRFREEGGKGKKKAKSTARRGTVSLCFSKHPELMLNTSRILSKLSYLREGKKRLLRGGVEGGGS